MISSSGIVLVILEPAISGNKLAACSIAHAASILLKVNNQRHVPSHNTTTMRKRLFYADCHFPIIVTRLVLWTTDFGLWTWNLDYELRTGGVVGWYFSFLLPSKDLSLKSKVLCHTLMFGHWTMLCSMDLELLCYIELEVHSQKYQFVTLVFGLWT